MYRMKKIKRAVSFSLIISMTMMNLSPGYISAQETEIQTEMQMESMDETQLVENIQEYSADVIAEEPIEEYVEMETQAVVESIEVETEPTETVPETQSEANIEEEIIQVTDTPVTTEEMIEVESEESELTTDSNTEKEQTENIEDTEPVADTEENSTEKESETETEESSTGATIISVEEDGIYVEVIDKNNILPEDTRICFNEIDPSEETNTEDAEKAFEKRAEVSKQIEQKLLEESQLLNEMRLYEFTLLNAEGNIVVPSEKLDVIINFQEMIEWETADLEGHCTVLALLNEKDQITFERNAEIVLDENSRIKSIRYETDIFSSIVLMDTSDAPADEVIEENDQAEAVLPVQTDDGVLITITAPASSFPYPMEEITATAKYVTDETAYSLVGAAVKDTELENGEIYFYDISLWHGEEEIEPTGPVVVTFEGFAEEADQDAKVFHVDEKKENITDMNAERTESGTVVMNTDHFSIYGVVFSAKGKNDTTSISNNTITAQWDQGNNKLASVTFSFVSTEADFAYQIQYSDNVNDWTQGSDKSAPTKKNQDVSVSLYTSVLDSAPLMRQYRIYGSKDNKGKIEKEAWSEPITIYEILETVKSGFLNWLENSYVQYYGGTTPADLPALYKAFALYYEIPDLAIASKMIGDELYVNATVDGKVLDEAGISYYWEYQEEDGSWSKLCDDSASSVNASKIDLLLNGGKEIRCRLYDIQGENKILKAMSNTLFVNPLREVYDQAIKEINSGLSLGTLEINGKKFTDYFYYDNVARDSRVPFKDASTYGDYLAKVYLEAGGGQAGLSAVKSKWDYYLYDLYDPSKDNNTLDHIQEYPVGTYGDTILEWPKDKASSFHGSGAARVEDLDYNYIENGLDYGKFVNSLEKSVKADAAGDANTERTYKVDISADTGEPVVAPLAMILQIQTSWQLFDLYHANALKGASKGTEVGAAAHNTALANLYDIKRALIRFVDYIDQKYPGNNLVLGVTEVQHAKSKTMLSGTDKNGKTLYVSNNSTDLKQQLLQWDTFGNCEHVHYDTNMLVNATNNLQSNLSAWTDMNGTPIGYDDIEKVAVIIGGSTENSDGNDGYGCTLPWSTFQSNRLNGVYSIRVNEGVGINGGLVSWLENSKNNSGSAFVDGTGTTFTGKYVASTEDAVLNALIDIAEKEMTRKGINVIAKSKYIENVKVTDTISDEFKLDSDEPITATIYDMEGNVVSEKTIALTDSNLTVTVNADGTTQIIYNFGTVYNTQQCTLHFGIIAKEDYLGSNNVYSNVGTPTLDYQHTKIDMNGNQSGIDDYQYQCTDTPQVNVPVNFEVTDGQTSSLLINEQVDLADLSNEIVKDVESRITKYDQLNGILNYIWVLPDGTTKDLGSITVSDGSIGSQKLPDRTYEYTAAAKGQYTGTLKITFTPDAVDDTSTNFADSVTATGVNKVTKEGKIWINVSDQGMVYIKKVVDNYRSELAEDLFVIDAASADQSVNTQVVLKHNETSAGIMIFGTTELTIKEILPKEYVQNSWIEVVGNGAQISGNKVTVQAGKIVTIVVHNTYEGKSFFHASASVTNNFQ